MFEVAHGNAGPVKPKALGQGWQSTEERQGQCNESNTKARPGKVWQGMEGAATAAPYYLCGQAVTGVKWLRGGVFCWYGEF